MVSLSLVIPSVFSTRVSHPGPIPGSGLGRRRRGPGVHPRGERAGCWGPGGVHEALGDALGCRGGSRQGGPSGEEAASAFAETGRNPGDFRVQRRQPVLKLGQNLRQVRDGQWDVSVGGRRGLVLVGWRGLNEVQVLTVEVLRLLSVFEKCKDKMLRKIVSRPMLSALHTSTRPHFKESLVAVSGAPGWLSQVDNACHVAAWLSS